MSLLEEQLAIFLWMNLELHFEQPRIWIGCSSLKLSMPLLGKPFGNLLKMEVMSIVRMGRVRIDFAVLPIPKIKPFPK